MISTDFAAVEARICAHILADALARYDTLTGGDIRADNEARPVVAGELAAALGINFDDACALLADALARRAATKLRDADPDIFELQTWVRDNAPELYDATRYLHPTNQYSAWLECWRAATKLLRG